MSLVVAKRCYCHAYSKVELLDLVLSFGIGRELSIYECDLGDQCFLVVGFFSLTHCCLLLFGRSELLFDSNLASREILPWVWLIYC